MKTKLFQLWRSIPYWGRWWIKALAFTATVYFGYDLYGRLAWWNFQSSYAAKGVSFDLESHFREITPEEDYFKSPTLSGWINSTDPVLVTQLTEWPKGTQPGSYASAGWEEGALHPLREYLVSPTPSMSDAKAAQKLQSLFATGAPAISRLIADSDRSGVCWKRAIPNIKGINDFMKILKARVRVHLQTGDDERALEELIAAIRFGQRIRESHTLIGLLVQLAAMSIIEDAIWDGIRSRQWDEAQLTRLLRELRQLKITRDIAAVGIREVALVADSIEEIEHYEHSGVKGWPSYWFSRMKSSLKEFSKPSRDVDDLITAGECLINSLMPKGHRSLGMKKYGEYWGAAIFGGPDSIQADYDVTRLDRFLKSHDRGSKPYKAVKFFGFGTPTFSKIGETTLQRQQFLDFAIISCELELHLMRTGQVPKDLSAFEVPGDRFCPHLPIRYERTGMTSYRLIACGKDRIDNKGAMSMDPFFEIKAVD